MKLANPERFDSWAFEPCSTGRYFACPDYSVDLYSIQLLMASVDTVRQLYRGMLDAEVFEKLEEEYEAAKDSIRFVHIHGYDFTVNSGGASGFKIRLQNNDAGLIIFVKSRYAKATQTSSHVKVEVSPKFLLTTPPDEVQSVMDGIAAWVLGNDASHGGVAVHMALDVQGWKPDSQIDERLHCRAQRVRDMSGIESSAFSLSEVAVTYGRGQSFLFGSAGSVQMALYNKSKEIISSDKRDFYHAAWGGQFSGSFSPSQVLFDPDAGDVWRLEVRFSHKVLNQFHEGFETLPGVALKDASMKCYADAYKHLKGLWQYSFSQFQLPHHKRDFVDPYWCLFAQDADFNQHHDDVVYKRVYKQPGVDNARNVALALGNILSIHARHGYSAGESWGFLKTTGIWDDVQGYLRERDISLHEFYASWRDKLIQRRMLSKVA